MQSSGMTHVASLAKSGRALGHCRSHHGIGESQPKLADPEDSIEAAPCDPRLGDHPSIATGGCRFPH